jgi:hypothetical protein
VWTEPTSKIIFTNVFDWTAFGGPMLAKPAQKLLDFSRFFHPKSQLLIMAALPP